MKKFLYLSLALVLLLLPLTKTNTFCVYATGKENIVNCKSYILMDKDSGKLLIENNSNERLPVASITKLMTILLTLEQIEQENMDIDDMVSVSENASGMGGSQIFLDANCEYSLGELLKSVIVCSANDSSVALAEHIAGSEELFVKEMNKKAKELGLKNTNYTNCTGLPAVNQYSSAQDVALVLQKVLDYPLYSTYSHIWLEDFAHPSGRTTEMTNTNKLSRFYEGCLGGKTGSTNEAKYCLAVGAERDNMRLIAVCLGSENSKERFANCSNLLNYGFANFENQIVYSQDNLKDIKIKMQGQDKYLSLVAEKSSNIISKKGENIKIDYKYYLPSSLESVKKDEQVGKVEIIINGELYDTVNLKAEQTIKEPSYLDYLKRIQKDFVA